MEFDHVEAFVAIVRGGGFTRAAATLHLSQPAISRRVTLLERELGAPLFDRIRSGTVLTEAGRTFLPYADALLASMRDGLEAVSALREADRGTVTLARVGTLASTTLTERLRQFHESHPAIDLRLRTALSREVSDLVRRGDATLGLRYDADPHPELSSTTIYDEPMVVVCSPRHPLARARGVKLEALARERWIGFPSRSRRPQEPYLSVLEGRLAACGLGAAEIIPIDSLTAQKRMVEAGFGLALLPESSIDEELRAGTLRALRVPAMQVTISVVLIHRRRGYQSGAARALTAVLSAGAPPRRVPSGGDREPPDRLPRRRASRRAPREGPRRR